MQTEERHGGGKPKRDLKNKPVLSWWATAHSTAESDTTEVTHAPDATSHLPIWEGFLSMIYITEFLKV